MKNRKKVLLSTLLLSAFAISITSCKKDSQPAQETENIDSAANVVMVNQAASQPYFEAYGITLFQFEALASTMVRKAGDHATRTFGSADACYSSSFSPESAGWPMTVTTTFDNCDAFDGRIRSGKIISVYSKWITEPGATATVTFENFTVDGIGVTGKVVFTNTSVTTPELIGAFDVDIEAGKLTYKNGSWSKIEGHLTYKQVSAGYNTPQSPFTTSGNLTGENSFGLNWKATTTIPVVRSTECHWPVSGVLSVSWNHDKYSADVDYGQGECDDKAEITFRDKKKEVTFRLK